MSRERRWAPDPPLAGQAHHRPGGALSVTTDPPGLSAPAAAAGQAGPCRSPIRAIDLLVAERLAASVLQESPRPPPPSVQVCGRKRHWSEASSPVADPSGLAPPPSWRRPQQERSMLSPYPSPYYHHSPTMASAATIPIPPYEWDGGLCMAGDYGGRWGGADTGGSYFEQGVARRLDSVASFASNSSTGAPSTYWECSTPGQHTPQYIHMREISDDGSVGGEAAAELCPTPEAAILLKLSRDVRGGQRLQ